MAQARRSSTEAVLAAASVVFRDKGYQRATIADIAEEAGISRPTIYQYVPSKKWLLDRISQVVMADMENVANEVAALDVTPLERLEALVRGHIAMSIKHRVFYEIMFNEETEFSDENRKHMRTWARQRTDEIHTALTDLVDQGQAREDVNPKVLAYLIKTMLNSIFRWYDESGSVSPDELAEQVLKMLSGLLTADKYAPDRGAR